jgi:hypothetical protein
LIGSADEFLALRTSDDLATQRRATVEEASDDVWFEVIDRYPDMRVWVARNKTVPHIVLDRLARDLDPSVRREVATSESCSQRY